MNKAVWPVLRALGTGLLMVAWAIAAHLSSAKGEPSAWGASLALAPLVLAAVLALWRLPLWWLAALGFLALAAGLVWSWPLLTARVATLFFVQHLGIYSLLALFFARSLAGPGESLVTQMARRIHGGRLSAGQERYTRKVTIAWVVFFAAMGCVSVGLFFAAPLAVWSTFANLLGGPLIGVMFVGEWLVRRWALPNEAPTSLQEMVRAWRNHRADGDR